VNTILQLAHFEPHAGSSLNRSLNGSGSGSRDHNLVSSSFTGSRDRGLLLEHRGASVPIHGGGSSSRGAPSDSGDPYGGGNSNSGSRNRGGYGGSSSGLAEGAWEPAAYAVDTSTSSSRRSSAAGGGRDGGGRSAPSSSAAAAAAASREPRVVHETKRSSASLPRPPPPQQAGERLSSTRGSRAPSEPQDSGSDGAPVSMHSFTFVCALRIAITMSHSLSLDCRGYYWNFFLVSLDARAILLALYHLCLTLIVFLSHHILHVLVN